MTWVTRRAFRSWEAWNSWVSRGTLLPRSADGPLGARNSLGPRISLLSWGAWFSWRTHISFGTWSTITSSHTRASQGSGGASRANQSSGARLPRLASGPRRSLYSLPPIFSWGTRFPHITKVTPLALLTRQPWQAIKAPITLRSRGAWEAPSPICSRAAHLSLSARGPMRSLKPSGTLRPHFSHLSFQTWIPREAHGTWASSEPHRARRAFHRELSLLQDCLSLGLLEGYWGSFVRASCKLERYHDHSAWESPDPINARDAWEASRAR